jgi:hypothetical protein
MMRQLLMPLHRTRFGQIRLCSVEQRRDRWLRSAANRHTWPDTHQSVVIRASTAFTSEGLEEASDNGAAGRTCVEPGMHNDVRVLTAFTTITAVASALLV